MLATFLGDSRGGLLGQLVDQVASEVMSSMEDKLWDFFCKNREAWRLIREQIHPM